jgi:hypothetical protein
MVVVQRNPHLLEVVLALCPPRRFTRLLHGRQQQSDQDRDDRNDHQQFDQSKAAPRQQSTCIAHGIPPPGR